jgi:hypothetical protein
MYVVSVSAYVFVDLAKQAKRLRKNMCEQIDTYVCICTYYVMYICALEGKWPISHANIDEVHPVERN